VGGSRAAPTRDNFVGARRDAPGKHALILDKNKNCRVQRSVLCKKNFVIYQRVTKK
jgi:hypothetical protein